MDENNSFVLTNKGRKLLAKPRISVAEVQACLGVNQATGLALLNVLRESGVIVDPQSEAPQKRWYPRLMKREEMEEESQLLTKP